MTSRFATCALALGALALVVPAAAEARTAAQPLVKRTPLVTDFRDRVGSTATTTTAPRARAAAAAAGDTMAFPTKEGYGIDVTFAPEYGVQRDVGASYVAFLDSLPHGPELARLKVLIVPPAQVGALCGGGSDVLACYDPATERMTVPGQETSAANAPSTSYVIAHEYGHHVARNRSDAPFSALDFGPKYWASQERVCSRTLARRLAPGDEGRAYAYNPGENWAETYARLTFPDVPWSFASLLKPDAASLAAARRDVEQPWTAPRTRTFTMPARTSMRTFTLPLRLDGSLRARVSGAKGSNVGLTITSGGRRQGATPTKGATHTLSFEGACRDTATEHVRFRVRRTSGTGPVALRVTYAG